MPVRPVLISVTLILASAFCTTVLGADDSADQAPAPNAVFKKVDKEGHVSYSSSDEGDAQQIHVESTNTVPPTKVDAKKSADAKKAVIYTSIAITKPQNGAILHSHTLPAVVTVYAVVTPPLDVAAGDRIQFYLNDTPTGKLDFSGSVSIPDLSYDTYTVYASVVNTKGHELISSDPISFTINKKFDVSPDILQENERKFEEQQGTTTTPYPGSAPLGGSNNPNTPGYPGAKSVTPNPTLPGANTLPTAPKSK